MNYRYSSSESDPKTIRRDLLMPVAIPNDLLATCLPNLVTLDLHLPHPSASTLLLQMGLGDGCTRLACLRINTPEVPTGVLASLAHHPNLRDLTLTWGRALEAPEEISQLTQITRLVVTQGQGAWGLPLALLRPLKSLRECDLSGLRSVIVEQTDLVLGTSLTKLACPHWEGVLHPFAVALMNGEGNPDLWSSLRCFEMMQVRHHISNQLGSHSEECV